MIKKIAMLTLSATIIVVTGHSQKVDAKSITAVAKDTAKTATPKKATLAEKTKGCKKLEGLFTIYQDTATGSAQLYIRKSQLGKEFIYQSFSISGPTELGLNQSMHRDNMVFTIKTAFDKLEFTEINTNLYYDKTNPVSKSAAVDKPDAVFFIISWFPFLGAAERIVQCNEPALCTTSGCGVSATEAPARSNIRAMLP